MQPNRPNNSNRWEATIRAILLSSIAVLLTVADQGHSQTSGDHTDVIGCWRGGEITGMDRPDEQYRLFSLDSAGNIILSLIFESGPRSQVWEFDTEVTYQSPEISWLAHAGTLNAAKDTMILLKVWKGDSSKWVFTRHREKDGFMRRLSYAVGDVYEYRVPENLDDGWECMDLSNAGLDKEKISRFMERITQGKHGDIHGLLIIKNNNLILEEYFTTSGKRFGTFITETFREKPHHLASTTKGVLSALMGIAIDQGKIKSVAEPIYPFLPEYSRLFTEIKKRIQIKHMLTMMAGFEWEQFKYPWNDSRNNGASMWKCDDVIGYVLERPMAAEPGKAYKYSNGVPVVLGDVLKNACGMEADKFAEKVLFGPLGIKEYLWTRYPDGSIETDGGLALRIRDLAKIGQLYLNLGKWNGRQIISETWIKESTKRRVTLRGSMGWGYGYQWMQADLKYKGRTIHSYFVPGDGGQILCVFPDLDMVIAFTAGTYGPNVKMTCYNMIHRIFLILETPNILKFQ